MRGIRTLVRGALPSLKERACVRAHAREAQVGMFDIPMPVIDGIGAGKIGTVQVTSMLNDITKVNIAFTRQYEAMEAELLVTHLRMCGFEVEYTVEPWDSANVG